MVGKRRESAGPLNRPTSRTWNRALDDFEDANFERQGNILERYCLDYSRTTLGTAKGVRNAIRTAIDASSLGNQVAQAA